MNAQQTNIYKNPLILFRKKTATFQSMARYMYTIDIGTTMLCRLYLDVTNILVVFPQIRCIENLDITWPVPSDFVKSRFHCTQLKTEILSTASALSALYLRRLALKQLSEIEGWSSEQLKAIIARAKTVWAQAVNEWDKDQVSELGKILSEFTRCTVVSLAHKASQWENVILRASA